MTSPRSPYDNVPVTPSPEDSGFGHPAVSNPDGSDAGPLYLSPEAEQWVDENIIGPGYVVDWGNRDIIDPNDGSVKGKVPKSFPRMM
jgi:hypothetical protein